MEALASRKVARREAYTEVSETAKVCTDEQKLYTEAWLNACLPAGRYEVAQERLFRVRRFLQKQK